MVKPVKRLRNWWQPHLQSWSQRLGFVPPWLLVIGGVVAGGILGLLTGASREWTGALVGLSGVALGGVIAAAANFALERERWKAQLTMTTWADRVRAHQALLDAGFGEETKRQRIEENWDRIISLDRVLIEGVGGHVSDKMLRELRREHEQQRKAR